jgi:hypothetical protein
MKVNLNVATPRILSDDELAVLVQQRAREVAAILRDLAARLDGEDPEFQVVFPFRDSEGNRIGEAVLEGL